MNRELDYVYELSTGEEKLTTTASSGGSRASSALDSKLMLEGGK